MEGYVALLQHDSLEAGDPFRELLIGVTNFFRDAPAFDTLAAQALPGANRRPRPGDPVRVLGPPARRPTRSPMLLHQRATDAKRNVPAQVFATDIDAEAIERARAGVYPISIMLTFRPAPGALLRAGRRRLPSRQERA